MLIFNIVLSFEVPMTLGEMNKGIEFTLAKIVNIVRRSKSGFVELGRPLIVELLSDPEYYLFQKNLSSNEKEYIFDESIHRLIHAGTRCSDRLIKHSKSSFEDYSVKTYLCIPGVDPSCLYKSGFISTNTTKPLSYL